MRTRSSFTVLSSLTAAMLLAGGCESFGHHGHGHDKDESLSMAALPAPVQAALKTAAGANTIESIEHENEDGQETYEATFDVNDIEHTVSVKPDGTIIEEETEMKVADLPAAASAAVLKAQPLATVKEASTVKRDGRTYFEIDAKVGEDKHELSVAQDGKLISDRVEAEKEEKDHEEKGWGEHGKEEKGEHKDGHRGEHEDKD
ncbi:MAG: putative beta-lactamase-inhibitor-like, PepSY-like [Phycisphaerales bacterium]|nr:putative beta-lactamase-inhibitor-like, PepSY-like [Phycisphaerales bacterium]